MQERATTNIPSTRSSLSHLVSQSLSLSHFSQNLPHYTKREVGDCNLCFDLLPFFLKVLLWSPPFHLSKSLKGKTQKKNGLFNIKTTNELNAYSLPSNATKVDLNLYLMLKWGFMKRARAAEVFKPYLGLDKVHPPTQSSTQPFSLLSILMFHYTLNTHSKFQTLHSLLTLFWCLLHNFPAAGLWMDMF